MNKKFSEINPDQKFIYFPSLSNGAAKQWFIKDDHIDDKTPFRFYSKDFEGTPWYYPYFLISAGHNMKDITMRDKMGLHPDSLVLGDSGGYQIVTGAIKWDPSLKQTVFDWLENNSDIAMILDIPPRGNYLGKFNEALTTSLDNFAFFEKHQTGKTQFLNVMQGAGVDEEYKAWYEAVKHFDFSGWAIAAARDPRRMLYTLALLLEGKEFEKNKKQFVHYLGISGIDHFLMLSIMQEALNKRYGGKIALTTDSSTPNRATIFGTYYYDVNWRTLNYISLYFGKNGKTDYNPKAKLPCRIDCAACHDKTYEVIEPFDARAMMIMTNHNVYLYNNIVDMINKMVQSPAGIIQEVLSKEWFQIYNSIFEMVNSDHPILVYNKYKQLYQSVSSEVHTGLEVNHMSQWFEFDASAEPKKKTKKEKRAELPAILTPDDLPF